MVCMVLNILTQHPFRLFQVRDKTLRGNDRVRIVRIARPVNLKLLDLGRAPYVSYGVKYIDPVSLDATLHTILLSGASTAFGVPAHL